MKRRYIRMLTCGMLVVLFSFIFLQTDVKATPEDVSAFYSFLQSSYDIEKDIFSGYQRWKNDRKWTNFGKQLLYETAEVISAAICDLNGDGALEMLTISSAPWGYKDQMYAWELKLYGRNAMTGAVELWDTFPEALHLESVSDTGMLSVHIQRSEGTNYILCDSSIVDEQAYTLSYSEHRVITVINQTFSDVTAFQSQQEGISGISLHDLRDESTMLARMTLDWEWGEAMDYTNLHLNLKVPQSAKIWEIREINIEGYKEASQADLTKLDRIVSEIESHGILVVHDTLDEYEGILTNRFSTDQQVSISVRSEKDSGNILELILNDSEKYPVETFILDRTEGYLKKEGSPELRNLYEIVIQSDALSFTEQEKEDLLAFELQGIEYEGNEYTAKRWRESNVGSVTVNYTRSVHLVGAESTFSGVTLTMNEIEHQEEVATPEVTEPPIIETVQEIALTQTPVWTTEPTAEPTITPEPVPTGSEETKEQESHSKKITIINQSAVPSSTEETEQEVPIVETGATTSPMKTGSNAEWTEPESSTQNASISEPEIDPETSLPTVSEELTTYPCKAVTNTKKVNVREQAGKDSRKVTTLKKKGTELTVTGETYDATGTCWYAVILQNNQKGYIRGDLVQFFTAMNETELITLQEVLNTTPEMVFINTALLRDQKLPVYSAPSFESWRGAKGKAFVSTNGPVACMGYEASWLLVAYDTNNGSNRIGYINTNEIHGSLPDAPNLTFGSETVQLIKAATLTDDTKREQSAIRKIKKGEKVKLLGRYGNLAYVETTAQGKLARGFLPLNCLE